MLLDLRVSVVLGDLLGGGGAVEERQGVDEKMGWRDEGPTRLLPTGSCQRFFTIFIWWSQCTTLPRDKKKPLCFSRSLYVQNQTAVRHLLCACKNATSFLGWQKFFGVFRKLSCHVSSLSTLALNEDAMAPGTRWLNPPFVFQKRTCRYIRKHATTAKREGNEASSSEACGLKNIGGNSSLLRLTTLQTGVEMERKKPRENQGTNAILTSNMHCSNHGNSGRSKVWVCAAKLWECVCVCLSLYVCVLCVWEDIATKLTTDTLHYYLISNVYMSVWVCDSRSYITNPQLCSWPWFYQVHLGTMFLWTNNLNS